jgi:hypothetical protein
MSKWKPINAYTGKHMLARVGMSRIKLVIVFPGWMRHIDLSVMGEKKKNPHAVALSKLGARKGGEARAAALSPEQRREIAQKAARARWSKTKKKTQ